MNRLSIIPTLLLIPPICMWITELPFHWRRVNISSILCIELDGSSRGCCELTIPGSSASVFSLTCQQAVQSELKRSSTPLTKDGYSGPAWAAPRCCAKATRRVRGKAARSGRAVAIRRESICRMSQKVQLILLPRHGEFTFGYRHLSWN